MYAQFRYLDGPQAGQTRIAASDFATIGRHPSSDVGFDPEGDLQVSVRHAAVFKQGGGFLVRDLGSTNGTFQNGHRVRGDRPLEPGDILQFGPNGPKIEFSIATNLTVPPRVEQPAPVVRRRPEIFGPRARTTERVRAEVTKQTRPWKWVAAAALVVATTVGALAWWQISRTRSAIEQQRVGLLARVDSLLGQLAQSKASAAGVTKALADARRDAESLRAAIASGSVSTGRLDTLGRELAEQAGHHQAVLSAAALDPTAASKPSVAAVAVVVGEFADGRSFSGTGFGIKRHGDTVWIATAGHLVRDSAGTAASRMAVIFNGSGQAFRAVVARAPDSADAALLVSVIRGGAPVVKGVATSASAGEAVAIVGYPLGLDSLGDWRRKGVAASGSVGTVTAGGEDEILVDGYGTYGSSGSPIFSADGRVVGLVSGRSTEAGGGLVAVTGTVINRLLARVKP